MNRPYAFAAALIVAALLPCAPIAAQQLTAPDAIVRRMTEDVLRTVQSDKDLQAGDRQKVLALAEQKVLPVIDFEEATRLAVGRAWNPATEAQREALVRGFRSMLVRIYSSAIGTYRGQTLRVLPLKSDPDATEVLVRNQYLHPGRTPVSVDYSMRKTQTGWKIYDITVEGVSLVLTYRSEFAQVVSQSGVDGLIRRLAEKNSPAMPAK
jgi:phospholipid transport system substrate-binding protein